MKIVKSSNLFIGTKSINNKLILIHTDMKRSITIQNRINPEIKVGDYVKLFDGSALSCDKHDNDKRPLYIVNSYRELTGMSIIIKDIPALVISTGITNKVCDTGDNLLYLQDIVVKIGNADFRTCSGLVEQL